MFIDLLKLSITSSLSAKGIATSNLIYSQPFFLDIKLTYKELSATWDKNTKYYQSEGKVGNEGVVAVTCYDWSKKDEEKYGWSDNLSIEIYNQEVANFIRKNS